MSFDPLARAICRLCQQEGTTSTVRAGYLPRPSMAVDSYYDETGLPHYHDGAPVGVSFHCSRGHQWNATWLQQCTRGDFGGPSTYEQTEPQALPHLKPREEP